MGVSVGATLLKGPFLLFQVIIFNKTDIIRSIVIVGTFPPLTCPHTHRLALSLLTNFYRRSLSRESFVRRLPCCVCFLLQDANMNLNQINRKTLATHPYGPPPGAAGVGVDSY